MSKPTLLVFVLALFAVIISVFVIQCAKESNTIDTLCALSPSDIKEVKIYPRTQRPGDSAHVFKANDPLTLDLLPCFRGFEGFSPNR